MTEGYTPPEVRAAYGNTSGLSDAEKESNAAIKEAFEKKEEKKKFPSRRRGTPLGDRIKKNKTN